MQAHRFLYRLFPFYCLSFYLIKKYRAAISTTRYPSKPAILITTLYFLALSELLTPEVHNRFIYILILYY